MSARTLLGLHEERWADFAELLVGLDDPREVWACVVQQNPLDDDAWVPTGDLDVPGGRLVVWSGAVADGLFERDPRTWLPRGMEGFTSWLERAQSAGVRLLVRPHARHVLCDAHRVSNVLKERDDLGLALSPAALIESDMLHDAMDHVVRTLETLGERADCVVLENVRPPETPSGPVRPSTLDEGLLDADELLRVVLDRVPETTPLVLHGSRCEQASQADRLLAIA